MHDRRCLLTVTGRMVRMAGMAGMVRMGRMAMIMMGGMVRMQTNYNGGFEFQLAGRSHASARQYITLLITQRNCGHAIAPAWRPARHTHVGFNFATTTLN